MHNKRIRVFLIVFGIVCGVIIAEYTLRIYRKFSLRGMGISQIEQLRMGRYRWWGGASIRAGNEKGSYDYFMSDNPALFYEPEEWFYSFKEKFDRNPFALRIFVLGDSTTRLNPGGGSDSNYYPFKLESMLNFNGKKYNVANCGVPGYSTQEEVEFFEKKLLMYNPNLVIVGYCLNDKNLKHRIVKKGEDYYCVNLCSEVSFCSLLPFSRSSYIHSELYRTLNHFLVKTCKALGLKINYVDIGKHKTIKSFKRLKRLSKIYNFEILFVIFPKLAEDCDSEIEWVTANLEAVGLNFINMQKIFNEYKFENLKIDVNDFFHFDEKGHMLVAEEVFKYIKSRNF